MSISSADANVSKNLVLDDCIYKPFTSPMPVAEAQQLVTMVTMVSAETTAATSVVRLTQSAGYKDAVNVKTPYCTGRIDWREKD